MSSDEHAWRSTDSGCAMPSNKSRELENMNDIRTSLRESRVQHQPYTSNGKDELKILNESSCAVNGRKPSSTVFKGRRFCFSASFPADRVGFLRFRMMQLNFLSSIIYVFSSCFT